MLPITVHTSLGHRGGGKTLASAIEQCAALLSFGATLSVGDTVAGPIGNGLWGCRTRRGALSAVQWVPGTEADLRRAPGCRTLFLPRPDDTIERDYSAFAAARMFVFVVGNNAAIVACKVARARAAAAKASENVNGPLADGGSEESASSSPLRAALLAACGLMAGCVPSYDWLSACTRTAWFWYPVTGLWLGYRALRIQGERPWSANQWLGGALVSICWPVFVLAFVWRAMNMIIEDGFRDGRRF